MSLETAISNNGAQKLSANKIIDEQNQTFNCP